MQKKRNIVAIILLGIFTCGIYPLFWVYATTNEVNSYIKEEDTNGGMAVVLSIVTCGIYLFYWFYKMGKKVVECQKLVGMETNDESIVYLILSIFGLSILSMAMIQNNLNKVWDKSW